jgi:pimeloyl-ACP methyl ester carboxylesterase
MPRRLEHGPAPPDGYTQAAGCSRAAAWPTTRARYSGPVLVAGASADTITPPAGCEAIAATFPQGSYRLLEGIGHLSYLDAPDTMNALIGDFAAACLGRATA